WTSSKVYCPTTGTLALRQDCESYQLVKSLYSIANGGFGGAGLGKGTFTTTDGHALIPYVNSDFIYSALAQELGLIGVAALLLVISALVVATTYWQSWAAPGLAEKQDNAIQRVAQFRIRRGLIYASDGKTLFAANRASKKSGETLYFRRYPTHGLASQVVGYS